MKPLETEASFSPRDWLFVSYIQVLSAVKNCLGKRRASRFLTYKESKAWLTEEGEEVSFIRVI